MTSGHQHVDGCRLRGTGGTAPVVVLEHVVQDGTAVARKPWHPAVLADRNAPT